VNLNTTSTRRANAIAFDIREKGRPVREGNLPTGKPVKDEHGQTVWQPGSLQAVKAIGWFIKEYGVAQVSINLTNLSVTRSTSRSRSACARPTRAACVSRLGDGRHGAAPGHARRRPPLPA